MMPRCHVVRSRGGGAASRRWTEHRRKPGVICSLGKVDSMQGPILRSVGPLGEQGGMEVEVGVLSGGRNRFMSLSLTLLEGDLATWATTRRIWMKQVVTLRQGQAGVRVSMGGIPRGDQ